MREAAVGSEETENACIQNDKCGLKLSVRTLQILQHLGSGTCVAVYHRDG
jgi:hypothetical protein